MDYTPHNYLHGLQNTYFANAKAFAKALCRKHIFKNRSDVSLTYVAYHDGVVVYALIALPDGGFDLDFVHVKTLREDDPQWSLVQNSKHPFCFSYLNINHNPNFLMAPPTVVEPLFECKERFTANGKAWLSKMAALLKSSNIRHAYKKLLADNPQVAFLNMASRMSDNMQKVNANISSGTSAAPSSARHHLMSTKMYSL